jgi:hypothetical protein
MFRSAHYENLFNAGKRLIARSVGSPAVCPLASACEQSLPNALRVTYYRVIQLNAGLYSQVGVETDYPNRSR